MALHGLLFKLKYNISINKFLKSMSSVICNLILKYNLKNVLIKYKQQH